jgi:hypothetical protein
MRAMALYNRTDFRPTRLFCMASPFAKTTFGPPAPGITDTDKGALIADVLNGVVEMVDNNGNTHGIETMLQLLQAQTALTTITTAQTLFSRALPAGALNKLNRTILITGTVIFTVGAGTPTCTIAITLGGVTLCTITTAALAVSTNAQLVFQFTLSVASVGASGTLEAHGSVSVQLSGTLGTAIPQYFDQNIAVSSAVNLTSALTLAATIAASTTMASAQLRQGLVEVVN